MNQYNSYFCSIKLIPRGTSIKNFYDHKEIGRFLQGKKAKSAIKIPPTLILTPPIFTLP